MERWKSLWNADVHGRYDVFEFQVFSGWAVATGFVGAVYIGTASKIKGIGMETGVLRKQSLSGNMSLNRSDIRWEQHTGFVT
jgi:hypothetical protein